MPMEADEGNRAASRAKSSALALKSLIGVDVVVAVVAPVAAARLAAYWPLQIGSGLVGVWTFLMVWTIQHAADDPNRNRTAVRDAIAYAFVTTYLVIVSWSVFSRLATHNDTTSLDPLAQTLLSHFTYLTGIVVTAHLGAGALERFGTQRSGKQNGDNGSQFTPDTDTGN
jgi:hypothetical protein